MVLRRRIRSDPVNPHVLGAVAAPACDPADPLDGLPLLRPLQDPVNVDHASVVNCPKGVLQEVERRVREVQDDAVDRSDLPQDLAGVPLMRRDEGGVVRRDVRLKEGDRRGIRIRRVDDLGPTSRGDQDRVRPDAREGVRDDLSGLDEVCDSLPLRGKPRAEVRVGEIHTIPQPMLRVYGRGPSLSRDDLDGADSAVPPHAPVLDRHADLRVPPKDCTADFVAVRSQFFRNLDDGDVADYVERGGQRTSKGLWHHDDVLVTPDGHEAFAEFPFLDGEADLEALPGRKEQPTARFDDSEVVQQDPFVQEPSSNFLPALSRDGDGPRLHGPGDAGEGG